MEQALKGSHFILLSCNNHCALLGTLPWKHLFLLFRESIGSSSKRTGLQKQIWLSAVSAIGIWQVAGPAAWSFVLTMANPDSVAFYPLWQLCTQKEWGKGKASRRIHRRNSTWASEVQLCPFYEWKQRQREIKWLGQGHREYLEQSWGKNRHLIKDWSNTICIGAIFLAKYSGLTFRDPPSLVMLRNQAVSCGRRLTGF